MGHETHGSFDDTREDLGNKPSYSAEIVFVMPSNHGLGSIVEAVTGIIQPRGNMTFVSYGGDGIAVLSERDLSAPFSTTAKIPLCEILARATYLSEGPVLVVVVGGDVDLSDRERSLASAMLEGFAEAIPYESYAQGPLGLLYWHVGEGEAPPNWLALAGEVGKRPGSANNLVLVDGDYPDAWADAGLYTLFEARRREASTDAETTVVD